MDRLVEGNGNGRRTTLGLSKEKAQKRVRIQVAQRVQEQGARIVYRGTPNADCMLESRVINYTVT
jgi:hypothetical protein